MLRDANRNRIYDDLEARLDSMPSDDPVEVIATMSPDAPPDYLTRMRELVGPFQTSYIYDVIPGFSAQLTKPQVQALSNVPWVRQIEPNARGNVTMDSASRWFGVQKARSDLGVDGDLDGTPRVFGANDVVIAILDTGIDAGHVDLDGGKVILWHDFVGTSPTPYDDHGHGTHVASIAAGTGDGDVRYIGVAPGAALVIGKIATSTGSVDTNVAVAGVNWVVNNRAAFGIRILSMSIKIPPCGDGTDALSQAVNNAWAAGIVVVVAAGNSGPGACTLGTPGVASGAITVGSMADPGAGGFYLHWTSSRGPTADGRVKPDIVGPGVDITAAKAGSGNGYITYSGTSMATPFVAGTVALMIDAKPSLTPNQVRTGLQWRDWGPAFQDNDYGLGQLLGYESVKLAKGAAGAPPGIPTHSAYPNYWVPNGGSWSIMLPMSDPATPIAATLLEAKTCVGLEIRFNSQVIASSHGNDRQDTAGASVSSRGMYEIRVMDDSWFHDCGSSFTLDVSYRADDWGSFYDAGGTFDAAMVISTSSGTGGFLQPNGGDFQDWYQVYVQSGYTIGISMTPLQGVNYDLQLLDPSRNVKATSSSGAGQTESISYYAGVTGYWLFVVYHADWNQGVYAISLSVTGGGGGGGGCVAKDTPILTDHGYVLIQKLSIGDTVMGYDLEAHRLISLQLLFANDTRESQLVDINDGAMVLTAVNQPIYISNATYTGWLPDPRNLTTDDSIFDAVTNTWVRVYALRFLDKQTKVYDVVTTGPNNFIANGFLLDRKLQ